MKKVGIITLNGYFNYGNRLQNYALQEVLEQLGNEVETIRFDRSKSNKGIKKYLRPIKRKLVGNKVQNSESIRTEKFIDFSHKYISETKKNYKIFNNYSQVNKLKNNYDYFVMGSDQVWNPTMNRGSSVFFGNFAEKEQLVSYAASFGVSEIPSEIANEYGEWLSKISHISVREEAGEKIVNNLANRDAEVLVDPTMLLNKEEWLSVAKRAQNRPDTPYILTYFLGGPSDEVRSKIEKIANERNMKIINLGDPSENETYETGPGEFVDYINNASVFLADSFHAVVFSIVLETPFVIFKRRNSKASMYSRIETILDMFDMKNREAERFNSDLFSMDFSHASEIIEKEKQKSLAFLTNALRIEE